MISQDGLVWFGLAWFGLAWLGLAWFSYNEYGLLIFVGNLTKINKEISFESVKCDISRLEYISTLHYLMVKHQY
ncbi:hypothetical protein SAMN05192540_2005 [Maribacter dokdonensis]|uniref:Uncharacterized protein n=1 Tax=Maribacter dokdonensis TaxID=320912 RepID=A0A1H4NNJ6_9FLAO|nr:hypothetical protein [Maribacter dokdonensis]SEB96515.1 hypothetical protein SAMN05192540_2005 [Maribacter dokdonensis]